MGEQFLAVDIETADKPEVFRIAKSLGIEADAAFGACFRVWSIFDSHSVDGFLEGIGPEFIDHTIRRVGFAEAMAAVGWLTIESNGLRQPAFDFHQFNGSAKQRKHRARAGRSRDRAAVEKQAIELGLLPAHGTCAESAHTEQDTGKGNSKKQKQLPAGPEPGPMPAEELNFVPDWPELDPFREQIVKPAPPDVILQKLGRGSVFVNIELDHLLKTKALVEWHSMQLGAKDPVVGNTRAHQVFVVAAGLHAGKMSEGKARSRIGIFCSAMKRRDWQQVESRIGEAITRISKMRA